MFFRKYGMSNGKEVCIEPKFHSLKLQMQKLCKPWPVQVLMLHIVDVPKKCVHSVLERAFEVWVVLFLSIGME